MVVFNFICIHHLNCLVEVRIKRLTLRGDCTQSQLRQRILQLFIDEFNPAAELRFFRFTGFQRALKAIQSRKQRLYCVRQRVFANSACNRANRSIAESRSAFNFSSSESRSVFARSPSWGGSPVASSAPSAGGNSCCVSSSCGSISDFPFVLAITLLIPIRSKFCQINVQCKKLHSSCADNRCGSGQLPPATP